jgi:hypothetical protein
MSVNFPILLRKIALVLTIACELSTSTILLDSSFIVILIVRCSISAKYFKDSMVQMILLLLSLNFCFNLFSLFVAERNELTVVLCVLQLKFPSFVDRTVKVFYCQLANIL